MAQELTLYTSNYFNYQEQNPYVCKSWILGTWEREGCLGYVEDMYENQEEEQMVQVRKLLFREDFEGRKPKFYPLYREVLITSIMEHISAFDVDGLDSVPAPCHFHKCEESLPLILWLEPYICCKELKDSSISAPSLLLQCLAQATSALGTRHLERSKVHQTGQTRVPAQLEEWVPIAREAASHEQGVPCASWLAAWPCPKWDSPGFPFEVGRCTGRHTVVRWLVGRYRGWI